VGAAAVSTETFALFSGTTSAKEGCIHSVDCHLVLAQIGRAALGEPPDYRGGPYSYAAPIYIDRQDAIHPQGGGKWRRCSVCAPDLPEKRKAIPPRTIFRTCPICAQSVSLNRDACLIGHDVEITAATTATGRALPAPFQMRCPGSGEQSSPAPHETEPTRGGMAHG
jgi:hypothetical protein